MSAVGIIVMGCISVCLVYLSLKWKAEGWMIVAFCFLITTCELSTDFNKWQNKPEQDK